MKRIVSLTLALVLVFSCVTGISAASGTAPVMTVGRTSATQGETVELAVTLRNNPGISSAIMKIDYDETRLTLADATIGEKFSSGAYTNINLPYVTFVRAGDVKGDEILLVLSFAVKEEAKAGDAYVTILYEEGDITNYDEEDVNFEVVPGAVTVARENPFTDVPDGSYYLEPVLWAVDKGITSGTTPTTFDPNGKCMRAVVVTFLWKAAGSPEPKTTENPFTDVKEGSYYYKAVLWAYENNVTAGLTATTFGPTALCNRAQVVTFLYNAMGKPEVNSTEHKFTDVSEGKFYYQAMLWAVENGITAGLTETTFGPNAICNRAQVVTFLYRAYNK